MEEEKIPLFTDLEIKPTKTTGLKRYLNSIGRNLPDDWQKLRNFSYEDKDSFKIIEDVISIRTPKYQDVKTKEVFYADIILGRTDSTIFVIKIKLSFDAEIEDCLEQIGFIMSQFNDTVLTTNKHYNSFDHQFTFGGPRDENVYKTDLRDERLIRLYSKKEKSVFSLAKSNKAILQSGTISFSSPNNISLSLSIMKKSYLRAIDLYHQLKLDKVKGNHSIKTENKSKLFDYFEEIISSAIFSYISVETMTNAAIPEDYQYENINDRGIREIWSKESIERWMSTSDKISNILPDVLKSEDIKNEPFWNVFKNLEKLRNRIVHQKTIENGSKLDSEIYEELLNPDIFKLIKSSLSVIEFFYNLDNAHPYFPLGMGIARIRVDEIESMEKHFKLVEEE